MTQSEPHISAFFATALVVVAFLVMTSTVIVGLWALHRLMIWVLG